MGYANDVVEHAYARITTLLHVFRGFNSVKVLILCLHDKCYWFTFLFYFKSGIYLNFIYK